MGLTGFFAFAYHDRYWRHRDCFNELGRCYVSEETTVYTTSGFIWGFFALLFAALALLSLYRLLR
jgi:hypothetical protein